MRAPSAVVRLCSSEAIIRGWKMFPWLPCCVEASVCHTAVTSPTLCHSWTIMDNNSCTMLSSCIVRIDMFSYYRAFITSNTIYFMTVYVVYFMTGVLISSPRVIPFPWFDCYAFAATMLLHGLASYNRNMFAWILHASNDTAMADFSCST